MDTKIEKKIRFKAENGQKTCQIYDIFILRLNIKKAYKRTIVYTLFIVGEVRSTLFYKSIRSKYINLVFNSFPEDKPI